MASLFPSEAPPVYPFNEEILAPVEMDSRERKILLLNRRLLRHLKDGGFQPRPVINIKKDIERYSDRYIAKETERTVESEYRDFGDLDVFPKQVVGQPVKKKQAQDINWDMLEAAENMGLGAKTEIKQEDKDEEENALEPRTADGEEDEVDDDYVQQYFDNGEGDDDQPDQDADEPMY